MTDTPPPLEELRRHLAFLTEYGIPAGEWQHDEDGSIFVSGLSWTGITEAAPSEARVIVAAVNSLPALIAEVERLREAYENENWVRRTAEYPGKLRHD